MPKGSKAGASRGRKPAAPPQAESYQHPEAKALLRPDVGTQAQFKKKKPPRTYRYDSSLAPESNWDGQNAAREFGEWLLGVIDRATANPGDPHFPATFKNTRGEVVCEIRNVRDAVEQLKRLAKPFLNWAGKAERLSFDVPTLPLFIHERLSTKAILETLKGHKRDKQLTMFDLFGDPQRPIHDQVLKAYEHVNGWTNRMILGDSLVVMNSLLGYEGLGGQVQMIYMDPPYGVKFGSNFQPFVRARDVKHNDDDDMTREPEMVKAYRDTWELGLHSYLTYMRDRLLLCRDLLAPSGSLFVQISDENVHYVRGLLDEIFGAAGFCAQIAFTTTTSEKTNRIAGICDYLLWYARSPERLQFNPIFTQKELGGEGATKYRLVLLADGREVSISEFEETGQPLPSGARVFYPDTLISQRPGGRYTVRFEGNDYRPDPGYWKPSEEGFKRLIDAHRIRREGEKRLRYIRFFDDFPFYRITNVWNDLSGIQSRTDGKVYSVQTPTKVIERCMLMTSRPGDLVLDPTCGSGSTAYVAEQWGRRWITIDTSRVPLALARQRLLTRTFPYYELQDESRGPAGGFSYKAAAQSKNPRSTGPGIVPHVMLENIANDEPPRQEVLVDRPEEERKTTRVTGPFCVEASIPTPIDWGGDGVEDSAAGAADHHGSFVERMIEVLRRSPVLHLAGGKTINLRNVRPPAKTLSLHAEAQADDFSHLGVEPTQGHLADEARRKPVAIVFGPENGAISEKLVYEAAKEANAKSYTHLYVIGFAIQPVARDFIDKCEAAVGVPATYVQATPDLMMGDLLKNMRSSQIFSVCGLPEVEVRKADSLAVAKLGGNGGPWYQVELVGLDVFDPATMENVHRSGDDVPCWLLDTDYNGLCFHVCQAFFPRTAAWDDLKKALKGEYEDDVWTHLAGTTSAPFEPGEHKQIAVKVIDDRGNELMIVKDFRDVAS